MIEELRTLIALSELQTMTKVATYLRVSQSTVSKRLQSLEDIANNKITRPVGRKVELTDYGRQLAFNAPKILLELEFLFLPHPSRSYHMPKIEIGIGESILTSWVARSIVDYEKELPSTKLVIHAHRAQVIVDKVMSGEYHLGLGAKKDLSEEGLHFEELYREPFVLIPSGLKPFRAKRGQRIELVTIEESGHSWKQIANQARDLNLVPTQRLESFFAAAQLAINGFGHGLVPQGTAEALGVLDKCEKAFSNKLFRGIGIFGKKRILNRHEIDILRKLMKKPKR